jgi:PAS domain S-box-containing protein
MTNTGNSSALLAETTPMASNLPPCRILLVEDEESHARIIQRSFERDGASFELTIASTLSEGTRAMESQAFDLVISDWRLPDGEGFELLKDKPRYPLLIMTSHGNEQVAVEAMRAGALDYVVKSETSLLAMPRIAERAIRLWISMAARQLAEEELRTAEETMRARRKEEEWFRLVVEAAPYAMIVTKIDGLITVANSQAEKLFGYRREELVGQFHRMLVPERFRAGYDARRNEFGTPAAAWGIKPGQELFGLRKDGSELPVEVSIDPIGTPDGQYVLASILDITERKKADEHVQLFQTLVDGVQDYAIFMLDPEGYVISWNDGAARLKGYSALEIAGRHFSRFYTAEDIAADLPGNALRTARAEGKFEDEGWRVRRDGSRFWANSLITVLLDKNGNLRGFSKLTRDITERKQARERLQDSERNLRLLADAMPQMVWTARPDGQLDYYNQRWYEFKASSKGDDGSWNPILHPDDVQRCLDLWYSAVDSGCPYEIQYRFRDPESGDYRWYLARALPLRDEQGAIVKWVGTATDIDDHKRLSEELEQRVEERTKELRQSLAEKTTLLQEVHHRVKNNLQVVCSLLSMQIACAEGDQFAGPLEDAHSRVLAMSLIHEQIYQSDTLADLDFGQYIEALAERLFKAYCVDPSRIRLEVNVDLIHLDVNHAIPCGLILNELLSNSLKHAFRDGREGAIRVSLKKTENGYVELMVADDGNGLPVGFRLEDARSLGLLVVRTLIHQLRAEVLVTNDAGAAFKLGWRLAAAAPRMTTQ